MFPFEKNLDDFWKGLEMERVHSERQTNKTTTQNSTSVARMIKEGVLNCKPKTRTKKKKV